MDQGCVEVYRTAELVLEMESSATPRTCVELDANGVVEERMQNREDSNHLDKKWRHGGPRCHIESFDGDERTL